jgi:type II secretory pathway pseudopilin PulG
MHSNIPPPVVQPNYQNSPQPPKRNPWPWVIGGCAISLCLCGPIVAAILLPVFVQAREAAAKTALMTELKATGVAILVYAADHDERYPPTMGDPDGLYESLGSSRLERKLYYSYETAIKSNPQLAGIATVDVKDPANTVMLYKETGQTGDYVVVLGCDTGARSVKSDDLKEQILNGRYQIPAR